MNRVIKHTMKEVTGDEVTGKPGLPEQPGSTGTNLFSLIDPRAQKMASEQLGSGLVSSKW